MTDKIFFFQPSPTLCRLFIVVVIATTVGCAFIIPIPIAIRVLVIIAMIVSTGYHYSYYFKQKGYRAIAQLLFHQSDQGLKVQVVNPTGIVIDHGRIINRFISSWLSVIVIKGRQNHSLIIFPDSLDSDSYRRLRILLRFV